MPCGTLADLTQTVRGFAVARVARVEQAVGGQSGAYQFVDRAEHDVTEIVHASLQARVCDQGGDERAHADHGPVQHDNCDNAEASRGIAGVRTRAILPARWAKVQAMTPTFLPRARRPAA